MVTVINTPAAAGQSSSAGWIVAGVLVIAATLVALFVWPGYARQTAEPTTVRESPHLTTQTLTALPNNLL